VHAALVGFAYAFAGGLALGLFGFDGYCVIPILSIWSFAAKGGEISATDRVSRLR